MKYKAGEEKIAEYGIELYFCKKKTNRFLVVCHGFGDTKIQYEEFQYLFDELTKEYTVVTFTFSNCDNKINNVWSVLEWVEDLKKIVSWIYSNDLYAQIYFLGISMGAWVSSLYCCVDGRVCKNICIGPVFTLHTGMRQCGGVALLYAQGTESKVLNGIQVKKSFLESLIINQPINKMIHGVYHTPTILFVGERDNIYRKTDAIIAESVLMDRQIECIREEIPKGRHFINNEGAIQLLTSQLIDCI